ncbi:hypothetical protein ABFX02_06G163800 [Erythranthe guttata]
MLTKTNRKPQNPPRFSRPLQRHRTKMLEDQGPNLILKTYQIKAMHHQPVSRYRVFLKGLPTSSSLSHSTSFKTATKNFSRSLMLGEGGFGPVYRGVLRDDENSNKIIDIAVKQLSTRGLQGHKEWINEVNVLGIVEHPNLVKLIGHCAEDDERGIQRLLIYEYMPNRSIQDHISSRFHPLMPWITRLN